MIAWQYTGNGQTAKILGFPSLSWYGRSNNADKCNQKWWLSSKPRWNKSAQKSCAQPFLTTSAGQNEVWAFTNRRTITEINNVSSPLPLPRAASGARAPRSSFEMRKEKEWVTSQEIVKSLLQTRLSNVRIRQRPCSVGNTVFFSNDKTETETYDF